MIFFLPRLMPVGPVEKAVAQISARGAYQDPKAAEETIRALKEMYGLDQGLLQQYIGFWRRLFTGDFGPSLVSFPTPVSELIATSLPWTFGLLLFTSIIVFLIGNLTGGLAGYFRQSKIMTVFDGAVMIMAPMPYYIVALLLIILFAHVIPIFPIGAIPSVCSRASTGHSSRMWRDTLFCPPYP
jgi:peptide/nickel transport system permease protein